MKHSLRTEALRIALCSCALLTLTFQAQALDLIEKPDFPVTSAEFGHSVAKNGKYIVVGSDQHEENGTQKDANGGAIYLLTEDGSEPVQKYQFRKPRNPSDPNDAPNHMKNYFYTPTYFGGSVSISDNWIVATGLNMHKGNGVIEHAAVVIPKGSNGKFVSCPEVSYVTDCTGVIEPFFFDDPMLKSGASGRGLQTLKARVSNRHFAVANPFGGNGQGIVSIWTWSDWQNDWVKTNTRIGDSSLTFGHQVALSDKHLVIAAPTKLPYTEELQSDGSVQVEWSYSGKIEYSVWNETHKYWITKQLQPVSNFVGFAYNLALDGDKLVVSSGIPSWPYSHTYNFPNDLETYPLPWGRLDYYEFNNASLEWVHRGYRYTSSLVTQLDMEGDEMIVVESEFGDTTSDYSSATWHDPNFAFETYQYNGTNWQPHSYLTNDYVDLFAPIQHSQTVDDVFDSSDVAISNGSIVSGWRNLTGRIFSSAVPLSGAVIVEETDDFIEH